MKSPKAFTLILAVLFVALVLTPMVSAEEATGGTVSTKLPDVNTITLPQLQFVPSQEKVTITSELSPKQNIQTTSTDTGITSTKPITKSSALSLTPTSTPYGAIIHHSKNGVTTVFDETGRQLFAADDANAATVTTPQGDAPATFVHEIPSGSIVTEHDGTTYVFHNGNRVLALVNENSETITDVSQNNVRVDVQKLSELPNTLELSSVSATVFSRYRGWIEYAESSAVTVDRFESTWTAPRTTPSTSGLGEALAIFNGIERSGTDGIMQPVLMWNFRPTGDSQIHNEYKGAAWEWQSSGNVDNMHSTPIAVSPGDTVRGTMQWSPSLSCWIIQFKNVNTGSTTSFYTTRFPRDNLILSMALEATDAGVKKTTDSLPGTITFTDNIIQNNGRAVTPTFTAGTGVSNLPDAISALSAFPNSNPVVTTNPLKVTLYTGR